MVTDEHLQLNTLPKRASFAMSAKKSHEVERFTKFVCDDVLKKCDHIHQVSTKLRHALIPNNLLEGMLVIVASYQLGNDWLSHYWHWKLYLLGPKSQQTRIIQSCHD